MIPICITIVVLAVVIITIVEIIKSINTKKYLELEAEVLKELNFKKINIIPRYDEKVIVKSRQSLEKYDEIKFFKENKEKLTRAKKVIEFKNEVAKILTNFLKNNGYKERSQYDKLEQEIKTVINNAAAFRIQVVYISSAGNHLGTRSISLNKNNISKFDKDPSLLMSKSEYNKYLKEQQKEALSDKQHQYYDSVNKIIDFANKNREVLFVKGSKDKLDNLIAQLFDRTVNSIKKIKSVDSEEWHIVSEFTSYIDEEIKKLVNRNQRILEYYESSDFLKFKETCNTLMSTQKEFNDYITEKVQSISSLFGTRVVRNETTNEDEYQYIRPYKKTVTPFTAEVSANVFSSAENNPLEYVVKNFYPDKTMYSEQIEKLHLLVEELETLREARQIIENYKKEYQQYLGNVPDYVLNEDEVGFYSRLGFANVDENVLVVEYKFSYTSGGGMAKREFTIPMTEETIVELIKLLEGKLTEEAFTKQQRALMTKKLREFIKSRDDFTCCKCGSSAHLEPNLLLEIDHIIPVSKGGCTVEENLQTLCWKCNRSKGSKIIC